VKRAVNAIRFVQLKKPLQEVLESFDLDPLRAARLLRNFVESVDENLVDDRWRIRVVNQHDLWKVGCSGGVATQKKIEEVGGELFQGNYSGGKWGIYLRAPDIFFKLLDRCGARLVPLGQIAEIRRGVTSGADDFFFVRDVTEDEVQKCSGVREDAPAFNASEASKLFKEKWGIRLTTKEHVRVVESGDGSRHLIEAEYLEPEVHSLMEIDSVEIDPAKLSRKILLVADPPEKLKGTHVLKYIKYGEREGFDQGSTVQQRAASRQWYDLKPRERGQLAWPKSQQYRHIVALNSNAIVLNCNLYEVYTKEWDAEVFAGILNSTIVALSKFQFGRFMGREGNLKTEIVDVQMMLVPHPRFCDEASALQICQGLASMRERAALPLVEEFDLSDRQLLDDAVLKLLGLQNEAERKALREEMYREITCVFKEIREVELEMQEFRRITARRDRASPRTIAEEIWEEFDKSGIRPFPQAFISSNEETEQVTIPAGKPKVLDDLFDRGALQVNGSIIRLGSKSRAEFAAKIVELGHYGPAPIPKSDRACERALEAYRRYETQMEAQFRDLAEERSADAEIQSRIGRELWKLFFASTRNAKV